MTSILVSSEHGGAPLSKSSEGSSTIVAKIVNLLRLSETDESSIRVFPSLILHVCQQDD